ncbi:MAG: preprotein translocase subunit SecA, partial [Gammaproteobacteria bacterium]|nr:preprotein translocase subunit SecA [Gammaproteobacteria bacterium]
MVMKILGRLFGTKNSREINRLKKVSDRVNGFETKFEAYSDLELKAVRTEFVNRLSAGETLKALQPEAFAVVREAGKRALGMRIFDVQMVGAVALHEGRISEMRTGEGKTLAATL